MSVTAADISAALADLNNGNVNKARLVLEALLIEQATTPPSARAWEPRPDARRRAESAAKVLDVDLHIDRYIIRCRERGNQPTNTEWLRWFMDDEQAARIQSRKDDQHHGVDTVGVPTTWH